MLLVQLVLYCLVFTLMVKISVIGGAVNGLYFYPKEVQDRIIENGLITRKDMNRKRKRFMVVFCAVMLLTLLLILVGWNHVTDFWTAYVQSVIFLEVMNWFDGVIIDKLWVGKSRFWKLPGIEDLQYVQTWSQVFKKRGFLTVVWLIGGFLIAGIVVLLSAKI